MKFIQPNLINIFVIKNIIHIFPMFIFYTAGSRIWFSLGWKQQPETDQLKPCEPNKQQTSNSKTRPNQPISLRVIWIGWIGQNKQQASNSKIRHNQPISLWVIWMVGLGQFWNFYPTLLNCVSFCKVMIWGC